MHMHVHGCTGGGVREVSGRPWPLVLKCCWSHIELTDERKWFLYKKNGDKGENAMDKKMEICQIYPKQLSFSIEILNILL